MQRPTPDQPIRLNTPIEHPHFETPNPETAGGTGSSRRAQEPPVLVLVTADGLCGCCDTQGEHPCGHECGSCDGSGTSPESAPCTLPHGADCRCRAQDGPVEATGSPDPEWLALLDRGRAGGEDGASAICDAYSRGIQVGLQRAADAVDADRAQQVYRDLCAAQLGDAFAFEQQPDRHVLVVIGAFNGTVGEQPQPAAEPTNTTERAEDTVRRFAGELWRLASGLADRGIPLRDGEVQGAAVDTALAELDRLRAYIEQRDQGQPSYRTVAGERPCGDPACICTTPQAPPTSSVPQDRTSDGVPEVEQATQRRCLIEEPHAGHRWYAEGTPLVCGGQV